MGSSSKFLILLSSPFPRLYPFPSAFRFARHSRIPLATSSSIQNRIFTSNLSPKLNFTVKASEQSHTQTSNVREGYYNGEPLGFSSNSRASHPWPEWSKLVENLRAGGYFNYQTSSPVSMDGDDAFSVFENLPEEFVRAASACLLFARDRSDILGSLSRKDIEVVVENGTPFLFKNALDSGRLMRSFLVSSGSNVLEHERAHTVDLMRFLLSYACNPLVASDSNNLNNRELVDSSVRNLLNELADVSRATRVEDFSRSMPKQFPDRYGQTPRPFGQNIEMKRGDWICTKCNFMNFARNMKCLECDEARPRKQVTGGEWECPQCDFFNYGRNMVCLRCDCKRPGEASLTGSPGPGLGYSYVRNSTKAVNESRIATNDEKAERWFSKVSLLDNASDISNAAADEDFPEIMPLRKGVNRFVVSTRKTPLERRLANAQYRRNLGNDGTLEENDAQSTDSSGDTSISGTLDRIIGHASPNSETESGSVTSRERIIGVRANNSIPFVPLPADMFGNPQKSNAEDKSGNSTNSLSRSSETDKSGDGLVLSGKPESKTNSVDDKEQAEKSERWFKKVAELHDVTDLASAISDEDFPEIMPMRKGENRFVVSKKKDRSLTSPLYKRRMAMEQSSNTNFVPFVPFPPDYFSKKDKQPDSEPSNETSVNAPEKYSGELGQGASIETQNNPRTNTSENYNSGSSWKENTNKENTNSAMGSPLEQSENPRKVGFSGKSLEGSAVKEPDPLDMSEEAKAERWFRRVAQIKDISELANIPDEDFPQIMPMRKGVNRFVVSKRKTPLERRLTSPQYRRNLPIVSSDPAKKENDTS